MSRRVWFLPLLFAPLLAEAGSRAESEKRLQAAADARNMAIEIAGNGTKADKGIKCTPMSSSHATIALPLFLPQLERYPTDFFSGAGITRIVLCGDLSDDRGPWGGLAVYASNTFYVSLKYANTNPSHATKTFHHEVFHLIDSMDDTAWSRAGGGHVSDYAKTSPKEDRAETFAEMMMAPKNASRVKAKAALIKDFVDSNYSGLSKQLK